MRVRLTPEAQASLDEIADYIAIDSPARARSFIQELKAKALEVGDQAHLYPIYRVSNSREIRCRVVGNYLILYIVLPDRVSVLDIRHGARDPDRPL